jgi:hypothetical protein
MISLSVITKCANAHTFKQLRSLSYSVRDLIRDILQLATPIYAIA